MSQPQLSPSVCRTAAVTSAFGLALAVSVSPGALNTAAAQTCDETHRTVTGGTFNWGLRDSFLSYIQGNIAKGEFSWSDGAGYDGREFTFPAADDETAIDGDSSAVIPLDGELNFYGHAGALDITLSDFSLDIDGSNAELTVDYSSYESDYSTAGETGAPVTGNDEVLITIDLNQTPDFSTSTVDLSGRTELGAGGLIIFGDFYGNDPQMADTSGTFQLGDACGTAPDSGRDDDSSTGRTDSGATDGVAGLLGQINDTFIEVNGLLVNTDDMLDNADTLLGREDSRAASGAGGASGTLGNTTGGRSDASGATSGGTSGGVNTGTTAGGGTTGTTGGAGNAGTRSGGTASDSTTGAAGTASTGTAARAAAGGTGATAAGGNAGAGSGDVCTADGSVGVTSASATWGVRSSFRNYIQGSIANGGWQLDGVSEQGNEFVFTGNSGAVNPSEPSGSILFPGAIRFTGHNGTLDTRFSNLEIQFSGNSGQLVLNASSNSTDGDAKDYGRIALANLSFSDLSVSDSQAAGTASPTLTAAGAEAFGSFYPAGDVMDPISFTATLGGDSSCAAGQGTSAGAAGTGTGDASTAAALAAGGSSGSAPGSSGSSADGEAAGASVFDDPFDTDTDAASAAEGERGNQFQIRNAQASSGDFNDNAGALIALLLAGLVIAGGSMTSFVRNNPLG